MKEFRTVKTITKGTNAIDGAGVHLVRVVGFRDTDDYDPFLLLDAFDSYNPEDYIKGFPWHPHRGIETITYLINGEINHSDSLGNEGKIKDGDCQWMTAGSGIIHQEMPQASKRILGAQLWLNLPAKDKMSKPQYGDILAKDVPIVSEKNSIIRIISGSYKNILGAFQGKYVSATYLDVEISKNTEWIYETNSAENLFVYIVLGSANFAGKHVLEKNAILFSDGFKLKVITKNDSVRFLLFSAKPLKEPIAWGGPIVMNSREELKQAFKDLDDGTFIK